MKSVPQIQLNCMVWNKESHGLFDYESKECKDFNFIVSPNTKLYRQGDIIHTFGMVNMKYKQVPNEFVYMGEFLLNENENLQFQPFKQNDKDQDAYLKLNSNKQDGKYQLTKNDLIKLGRVEYFISEVQGYDCQIQIADDVFKLDKHISIVENEQIYVCKFCLSEGPQVLENPYMSKLCSCQGNIGYTHYECLKEWINSRIETRLTQNTVHYQWKRAMECEICQDPLPKRVYINESAQPFELIQRERLPFPYIILEQITRENGQSKSLVMIHNVNNEPVLVGRGNACEIRSNDISVSRIHASISWNDQEDTWQLEDQNSKFGTLIILKENVIIENEVKEVDFKKIFKRSKLVVQSQR